MEQLGVQPILLLAQIVNFGLVIFLLNRVLFKPIVAFLEKRKKEIDEGLTLTQKMQEEDEKLAGKREKSLEAARREAREITEEARRRARNEEKNIIQDAHKESQVILDKARSEAYAVVKASEKEVRVQAIELASLMLEHLIPKVLTKTEHKKMLSRELKEIEHQVGQLH